MVEPILFAVFAVLAVASAIGVIAFRNPVHSALSLVLTFFSLAGLFILMGAHFVAAVQVIVYAGAIMVLFLFVIMLLNLGREAPGDFKGPLGIAAAALLGAVLLLQLRVLSRTTPPGDIQLPEGALAELQREQGVVGAVARPLFSEYLIPFEITSLLLLAAIVGAVVLAKRRLD